MALIKVPTRGRVALADSDMPAGAVLQVVHDSLASATATTSASYVDTALSLTITPSSTSSKILIIANVTGIWHGAANIYLKARPIRGSVGLVEFGGASGYSTHTSSGGTMGTNQLDSPNTISATTYKIQILSATGASMTICNNNSISSITLMEIAG